MKFNGFSKYLNQIKTVFDYKSFKGTYFQLKAKFISIPVVKKINNYEDHLIERFIEKFDELYNKGYKDTSEKYKIFLFSIMLGFFALSLTQMTQDQMFYNPKLIDANFEYIAKNSLTSLRINEFVGMEDKEMDFLSWITLGNIIAQTGQAEFATQCYYMAHLLEPTLLGANSELQLDPTEVQENIFEANRNDIEENIKNNLFEKLTE